MKPTVELYIVIGRVEYETTDILGVYGSEERAEDRLNEVYQWSVYDKIFIQETKLNIAINDL